MSDVMEDTDTKSPVALAQEALAKAQAELAALDQRIRGYEEELEERTIAQMAHRTAIINAVTSGERVPKPPKPRVSDVEVALPILREQRKEVLQRIAECAGLLRRACVEEVGRRYALALDRFASEATSLTQAWRELVGVKALLDQAGVSAHVTPIPPALYQDFTIPALGRLRPICENHAAHFVASHSIAQGDLSRAVARSRIEVERDIGMSLPW